eukprot:GFUD01049285.1.p1 GENE.GFUD01049285.1~~GFUD01049285.1.p1  ORF type:complete len:348 (-),score=95.20 GFUD01049285.1:43-1086(-)
MKIYSFFLCLAISSCSCQYQTVARGKKYSEASSSEYKLYFQDDQGNIVSPWHDVPLFTQTDRSNQTYNMIVEIPRFSQAKFEIHREHLMNPIVQDIEDAHLRYLPNLFPWHGQVCNYGAFPQTWENPFHEDEWTGLKGDKDPIDVCEIGSKPEPTGTVLPVKIFGILALIDGGETDWKVIVMNSKEAVEKNINTLDDLGEKYPGLLESVRKFFRVYKVPSGKPENKFAYNGEVKDKALAEAVISFTHKAWKEMINNCSISGEDVGSFNTGNTQQGSACTVGREEARGEVDRQPLYDPVEAKLPDTVNEWSFLQSSANKRGAGFLQPFCLAVLVVTVMGVFSETVGQL